MFKSVLSIKIYLINWYITFEIRDANVRTKVLSYNTQINNIVISKNPREAALLPWMKP